MPHYWLGMVLVIIFSVILGWLPAVGMGSGDWAWDWEHIKHLILPAVTMSVIPMGIVTRTVRALVGDLLSQEFVTALRAKGISERRVFVHVAKNAAPTAIAVMGLQLGYLLGGSILIETVFSWPGTGFLLNYGDLPARPAAAAGHDPGARAVLRGPQSRGRRAAGGDRSAHQARLDVMSAVADDLVRIAKVDKARGYWATVGRRLLARSGQRRLCAE